VSPSTASEITVHRCVVHVVRRGGWSWGPDPRGLLQPILDALPDLLAEEFEELLDGEGPDVVITEPVRVTVRLGQLLGRGLAPTNVVVEPAPATVVPPADPVPDPTESPHAASSWLPPTPVALFTELAERGELEALLALLPDDTLRMYLLALFEDVPAAVAIDEATVEGRVVTELIRRLPSPPPAPRTRTVMAQLLASWPTGSPLSLPGNTVARTDPVTSPDGSDPGLSGERHVSSVLPFLLVGPLARIGYLDAIGPALAAAGLLAEAPLFAAALAYKVLGDVARGWRRTEEDNVTAATFAGLESVPDLTGFAHRVRPALPVLDGVLALSLCRGHEPTQPLLLTAADDELLLVDAQGMFPIAWAADVLPYWEACGKPPVAVCDSPLPPDCLRTLATAGVPFITDVRPLRNDPVTRLPWRTPLWASGDPPLRLAADLPAHTAQIADLVRSLVITRRAVPLAEDHALDHSVMLAAATGLGTIAWTLWRDREPPAPVLALTRFADLEATVQFTPDVVKVRVPLGRRHADLLRCGALTDVHDVVWLAGRTLTFSGG
jgi:hypothetical protein